MAGLSLPRGNGKCWLAARIVKRALTTDDPLFRPGTESVLCAASFKQISHVLRFAQEALQPTGRPAPIDWLRSLSVTASVKWAPWKRRHESRLG